MAAVTAESSQPHPGMGFAQFVAMIACMMALIAAAIDSMLPGLPKIAHSLAVRDPNHQQLVVTAFLIGTGGAQLIYGPLADRYGRKPVLLSGLGLYVVFSAVAALAPTFGVLLIARLLQGIGAAAARVLPTSIIRDCYSGRRMAQVTSFAAIVFMAVPIMAPTLGQALLSVVSWRWLFGILAGLGAAVGIWVLVKLPETLRPQDRHEIQVNQLISMFGTVLRDRASLGYGLGITAIYAALFGFLNSAQQVFDKVFHHAALFPLVFALASGGIAAASFTNARLVRRLGTRRISHTAVIGFVLVTSLDALLALTGHQSMVTFSLLQVVMMFCFGLIAGNFSAMAMENMGHIAGSASSVQGFMAMVGGALIGFMVGQAFNSTVIPLTLGYCINGFLCLAAALYAERGRLFRAHEGPVVVHSEMI